MWAAVAIEYLEAVVIIELEMERCDRVSLVLGSMAVVHSDWLVKWFERAVAESPYYPVEFVVELFAVDHVGQSFAPGLLSPWFGCAVSQCLIAVRLVHSLY